MKPNWPQTELDDLRRLWNSGLSTRDIGFQMGKTKNSVIGKAHRLGLKARPSICQKGVVRGPKKIRLSAPMPDVNIADIEPARRAKSHVHKQLCLTSGCRWINGEITRKSAMSDSGKCGQERVPGTSWCSAHRARVFIKVAS